MSGERVLLIVIIMGLCTYLPRMLPLVLFRRKITNRYLSSLLCYLPYSILAAMVFPAVFTATISLYSALAGTAVALFLAYQKKGLLPVAISATATVFVVERILFWGGWL